MPEHAEVKGEHIFPATQLTQLALRWKSLTAAGRHREAMQILEQVIIGSTSMFERLAQHEDFHYVVELPILVAAAQEKVIKWLQHWNPRKGRLFSWFSKCAKNAFRSEIVKVNQFRRRIHTTGEHLEKYFPSYDHDTDKRDTAAEVKNRLQGITSRWGDPQEVAALHYMLECMVEEHEKNAVINGAAYAWGITPEVSKFFYTWCLVAMRDAVYEKIHVPFTQQDLFRHHYSYTHLVNLLDIITWDQLKRIIATHGGLRLKIPTMASLAKLRENYLISCEVERSDMDPDAVAGVARKFQRSPRSAQEAFEEMAETLHPNRAGEHDIYHTSSASIVDSTG